MFSEHILRAGQDPIGMWSSVTAVSRDGPVLSPLHTSRNRNIVIKLSPHGFSQKLEKATSVATALHIGDKAQKTACGRETSGRPGLQAWLGAAALCFGVPISKVCVMTLPG